MARTTSGQGRLKDGVGMEYKVYTGRETDRRTHWDSRRQDGLTQLYRESVMFESYLAERASMRNIDDIGSI